MCDNRIERKLNCSSNARICTDCLNSPTINGCRNGKARADFRSSIFHRSNSNVRPAATGKCAALLSLGSRGVNCQACQSLIRPESGFDRSDTLDDYNHNLSLIAHKLYCIRLAWGEAG